MGLVGSNTQVEPVSQTSQSSSLWHSGGMKLPSVQEGLALLPSHVKPQPQALSSSHREPVLGWQVNDPWSHTSPQGQSVLQAHCGCAAGVQRVPLHSCPGQAQSVLERQDPGSCSIAGMQMFPRATLQTHPQPGQSASVRHAPPGAACAPLGQDVTRATQTAPSNDRGKLSVTTSVRHAEQDASQSALEHFRDRLAELGEDEARRETVHELEQIALPGADLQMIGCQPLEA